MCHICPSPCPCTAVPALKKLNLTEFSGTTFLVPTNAAVSSVSTSDIADVNKLMATGGFHVINAKLTLDATSAGSFSSVRSPKLFGPQTIYISRVTTKKTRFWPAVTMVYFGGSAAVASSSNAAKGLPTFYSGTRFNCIGVDKIIKSS